MKLQLRGIRLPLSSFTLQVDAELNSARTAIFGPSGAGKTSLLEIIVGLRQANAGSVQFDDVVFDDQATKIHLPIRKRRIGYLPQDDTLFPHFSARRNLLFGRRDREESATFTIAHVTEFLRIDALLDRDVRSLSRGEKQRIALGRALLSAPRLLLLDEPLTGLDSKLKVAILEQLAAIHAEFGVPMLYVTHDPAEAIEICDEVFMLHAGEVSTRGRPRDLLHQ